MNAVEFTTDPDGDDAQWRQAAYEQFLHDDSSEDAIYEIAQ